jgi:peptidoglycan/xylan/chitin deacetylase (PgdA/CDA1 family)
MANKDLRKLIKALKDQEFEVVTAGVRHPKVYKGGKLITTLPGSPSDVRAYKNAVSFLRQHGFVWQGR